MTRYWSRYRKTATTPMCWVETPKDIELALADLDGHLGLSNQEWRKKAGPLTSDDFAIIFTREGAFRCEYPFWLALDAQGGLYCVRPDAFETSYFGIPDAPFVKWDAHSQGSGSIL